jgi:hypothetical protein
MSGAFEHSEGRAIGFIKHLLYDPESKEQSEGSPEFKLINTTRSPV